MYSFLRESCNHNVTMCKPDHFCYNRVAITLIIMNLHIQAFGFLKTSVNPT